LVKYAGHTGLDSCAIITHVQSAPDSHLLNNNGVWCSSKKICPRPRQPFTRLRTGQHMWPCRLDSSEYPHHQHDMRCQSHLLPLSALRPSTTPSLLSTQQNICTPQVRRPSCQKYKLSLITTGGAIIPEQSYWNQINWIWENNRWRYATINDIPGDLTI
jgi:hypothetical protein